MESAQFVNNSADPTLVLNRKDDGKNEHESLRKTTFEGCPASLLENPEKEWRTTEA